MVDKKTAQKLVVQLKGMPGYPETAYLREQLGKALMSAATEDHAERGLAACLESSKFFPSVTELKSALRLIPHKSAATARREKCHACGGSGFVQNWYLVTWSSAYPGGPPMKTREPIPHVKEPKRLIPAEVEILRERIGYHPGKQVVTDAVDFCVCRSTA